MINSTNIIIPQPLKLDCNNYCSSLINIPNHKKAFFTFFRTKKAFFDEEYIVTDYRHQLINKNIKKEDTPNTFHYIMVYKINDFLNHPYYSIELNNNDIIKPLLTISLPTVRYKKLRMKLIAFEDKTIIIQEKSNEKNYLCISLNPNLSIIDSIVAEKSIPIETKPKITKEIVDPPSINPELKQTIKDDEKPSIIVDSIVAENPIPIATKPEMVEKKTIVSPPSTAPNSKTPHINTPKYRITKFKLTTFIFTTLLFLYHYKLSVINFLIFLYNFIKLGF